MDISLINSQSLLHLLNLTEKKEELLQILEQIDAEIISVLKGGVFVGVVTSSQPAIVPPAPKPGKPFAVAPVQAESAAATPVVAAPKAAKPAKTKKSGISPEGRAKLAASMKARWAARRAGKATAPARAPKLAKKGFSLLKPE